MKILIYDCEIIKAVPIDYKNEAPIEGIKYCKGWDDHKNMGISVIGCYSNWDKETRAFINEHDFDKAMYHGSYPLKQFQKMLNMCDVLVGFNNQHFDDNLIKANGFTIPDKVVNYDILVEMWRAVGIQPPFVFPTHAGYSLKQTCEANGLPPKTGDGGNAAIMWQRGKYQEVIDYCLNDIKITTELFRAIVENDGWINNPKTKIKLRGITE